MNQKDFSTSATKANKQIVIVAMTGHLLLDFAGPADVFNSANEVLESMDYQVIIVSAQQNKQVLNSVGLQICCAYSAMDFTENIDTLLIAGSHNLQNMEDSSYEEFYAWLQVINKQTRRIGSICAGAFVLAKAGLLNGKKATTHWNRSELLRQRFPQVQVDTKPFYISDGKIHTSGGVSSGIDLALALVEQDYGKDIAVQVARRLVFYPNRPGYQVQFGNLLPAIDKKNIAENLGKWMVDRLHERLDIARLAEQLHMSPRNFTRVFHKQTGISPAKYVEKIRVEAARKYLEESSNSLEEIARICGLGGLVSMRRTFLRHLMVTPSDYRRAFQTYNDLATN